MTNDHNLHVINQIAHFHLEASWVLKFAPIINKHEFK